MPSLPAVADEETFYHCKHIILNLFQCLNVFLYFIIYFLIGLNKYLFGLFISPNISINGKVMKKIIIDNNILCCCFLLFFINLLVSIILYTSHSYTIIPIKTVSYLYSRNKQHIFLINESSTSL